MSCFWGHEWGEWKITGRGDIGRIEEGKIVKIGENIKQERQCKVCDFIEINCQTISTV